MPDGGFLRPDHLKMEPERNGIMSSTTLTRIEVAKYSELPERIGQPIKVGTEEIALFRLSNGDVRAIENKSPHPKGGILSEGLVSGDYVFCPCMIGKFL